MWYFLIIPIVIILFFVFYYIYLVRNYRKNRHLIIHKDYLEPLLQEAEWGPDDLFSFKGDQHEVDIENVDFAAENFQIPGDLSKQLEKIITP